MRHLFLIVFSAIAFAGVVGYGFIQNKEDVADLLPGLEMTRLSSGQYDLTVSVPNSLGRKYHSKKVNLEKPFYISRHEITIGQWNKCFEEQFCTHKAKQRPFQTIDHPVTKVSWLDAYSFTQWLSQKTGDVYRLPTEEEWAYAAFAGQDVTQKTIDDLLDMRSAELMLPGLGGRRTRAIGAFGENNWNIADTGGTVWEWTMSCWFSSDQGNEENRTISELRTIKLCPNRIIQGVERAHVPHFVDEALSGGCSTGNPIDHIGFRMVREI
ncbi:MAG: SUMF1/EgtB/PvdO family nonheme iron enzyme [Rhodospirillales bacterium]|jgi:formylglycine-generating enzyme required for sulfatase activity|nr:SUMF1/EgtB/PvdO family nonheme iron enzyme [Rhodospirillales bacterium]